MNKIFMTKRRHDGEIAVCSELTRSKGKMKSFVAAVATAAALATPVAEAASVATVDAQNQVVSNGEGVKIETKGNTVAIGGAKVETGSLGTVAIGAGTYANGKNAVAVGSGNTANGTQTTVFGSQSKATMQQATAIGNEVLAAGYSSITIGGDDAGEKDLKGNLAKGANTQYATFVYDAALDEVISNPYSVTTSSTTKISIDPKDANDPSQASQALTRKTVVVATRARTENNTNNKVPLLSDAQKAMLQDLGIRTAPRTFSNVTYEREKNKPNTVVIDGSMTYEEMLNAALEGKDPANYLSRLLEKYKAEAQIAAGDTPLSDADATEKAFQSIENLAVEMGVATTDTTGASLAREVKIKNLLDKYYSPYQGTRTTGGSSIAIGIKAQSLADGAVSIGTAAISRGKESLALGVGTITSGERAIGMGTLSVASGDRSIAIGTYTEAPDTVNGEMRYDAPRALAEDAVAIGSGAYVGLDVSGTKSVALGAGSIVTTGYGDIRENYSKGTWEGILKNYSYYDPNKAPGINEEYKSGTEIEIGTLLPKGAKYRKADNTEVTLTEDTEMTEKVTLLNNVVETHKQFTLGKTTTGGTTGTVDKAYVGRLIYRDFAGATAVGAVSVGYSGAEKRIQNVAAGEVSPTSTDAINGSQLYIASQEITSEIENTFFHVNDGTGTQKIGDTNTNKGKIAEIAGSRGDYTVTAGINTRATGTSSSSLGHNAISGMIDGRYKELKEIDRVLEEKRTASAKAYDTIEASNKTIEYATERLEKIKEELITYDANKADLEAKLQTSNRDEKARISAQLTKLGVAKTELLKQQKDVTKEKEEAVKRLGAATLIRESLEAEIALKSEELKAFMNANAKSGALASGADSEAGGEASVALGKNAAAHGTSSIALGQDTISGLTKEDQKTIDDAVAKFDAKEKAYDTAVKALADLEKAQQTAKEEKAQAQKDLEKATEANDESAKTKAQALIVAADAKIADLNGKIPDATTTVNTSKTDLDAERNKVKAAIDAITAEGANKIKNYTIAIGHEAIASGEAAISIGKGNIVSGDNSGAFGDPSIVAGAGSYTQGNDNAVGSKAKNVGAFGNNNQIGATATYNTDGKLQLENGLANESAVENSRVVGNNNYINTSNTYVLGSGVGVKDDKSVLGTVANSVYLGNDSTAVETAGNNVDKDGAAGATTTAGATGVVKNATLLGVTYGEFAAHTAKGAVTVGSAGEERRIMNVAAGEISKTSTDAINGSQLYYVAKQAAKPFSVTANTNNDTDAETMDDIVYTAKDGKQVQLGETLNIAGSKTSKNLTRDDSGAVTDGTYSAKNIQTIVDDNGVQIQMAEKPEFKELTVKADDNDSNPVTITSGAGDTGGTISNLSTTLPDNAAQTAGTKPTNPTTTNAATLGDVLNSGWNVKTNNTALDFVQAYDTVNFANGNATAVSGEMKDGVATIKVDVQVDGSTITVNQDGKLTASQPETTDLTVSTAPTDTNNQTPAGKVEAPSTADADKLVKAGDIAEAINNAGFTLKSSATTGGEKDNTSSEAELINAGEVVEMVAGKNLTVKQEANGKITYATKDDVSFNSTTIGGTKKDDGSVENPITIGSVGDKNVISNLTTTLPENTTAGTKPTNPTTTNAATLGDVLNAGWNLQENGTAKDFVTAYDTVNFENGEGTMVNVTSENGVSKVKVDVQVDGSTITVNQDGKLTASQPETTGLTVSTAPTDANNQTPAGKVETPSDANKNKLVTAGDIANAINNAGFTLKSSATTGGEKDNTSSEAELINAGEVVEMVAGKNLTVKQEANGKITYATKDDVSFNTVTVGNSTDTQPDVNLTSQAATAADNNPTAPTTALNITSTDGKPTQITGVGSVLNTTTVATNPDANSTTAAVNDKLVNLGTKDAPLSDSQLNSAATVRDIANMGWIVSASGNEYVDTVKNANKVDFVGKGLAKVSGETKGDVRTITVDVDAQRTVEAADTPVIYTDGNGNKLTKVGDKFYPIDSVVAKDGKVYPKGTTLTDGLPPAGTAEETPVTNVIASMNDGDNKADNPKQLANVKGNLAPTYNKGDATETAGKLGDTTADAPTTSQKAPEAADVKKMYNNAATVGDVLNAGWNLQGNGDAKDFVKPYDTVNFINGLGTTVDVVTDTAGKVSNIQVNTLLAPTNATGDKLVKSGDNWYKTDDIVNGKPKANAEVQTPSSVKLVNPADNTTTTPSTLENVKSSLTPKDVKVDTDGNKVNGLPEGNDKLLDLVSSNSNSVNPNAAATVGDLQNMGWVVSARGNTYTDVVKNANEVEFVGEGVSVTGETDPVSNKRVITIKALSNMIATLENELKKNADGETTSTPTGAISLAAGSDAGGFATAGNLMTMINQSGWNLKENGTQKDLVNPADQIDFVNGVGTKVSISTDNKLSTIKVDIDKGTLTNGTDGKVNEPVSTAKTLLEAVEKAQKALDEAIAAGNKTEPELKALKDTLAAAEKTADEAGLNKVATVQNVAEAINNSGFTLKTDKTEGDNLTADSLKGGELINPGDTVTMQAGKNMIVKQEADGKVTYATKENVNFTSVSIGEEKYVQKDDPTKEVVKIGDKYYPADVVVNPKDGKVYPKDTDLTNITAGTVEATPIEADNVKEKDPTVKLEREAGRDTTHTTAGDKPTTTTTEVDSALSVKDGNGNNSQINGIASALDTKEVATKPTGKEGAAAKDTLVDLTAPTDATEKAKWESSAVTVGDVAKMGWIVSASGNEYTDTVKNANEVKFTGKNGIKVTGETKENVREITIEIEKGEVIGANEGTVEINGKPVEVVKITNEDGTTSYYKKDDVDPTTGTPKEGTTALSKDVLGENNENVVNNGNKFVDGNTVAKAIQESGFTVGKETNTTGVEFNNSDEKVNPNDELRFADGKGTTVSTGTVKTIDPNGEVSTKTVVKFDVDTVGLTNNPNGTVVTPAESLKAALDTAKAELDKLKADNAPEADVKAAEAKVADAQTAFNNAGNKIATAADVANAINNSGFKLKTSATTGGEKDANSSVDEVINPGDTVEMVAGKNLTVKQEANGKVTYATKDDVEFNTVQVGGKVDDQGNKLVKVGDSYYKATDLTDGKPNAGAQPVENANVKDAPSVVFSADKGVATKDTKLDKDGKEITTPNDAPTALSVKDKDGKDSQVNGIASALDTKEVATKPLTVDKNGNPVADKQTGKDTLVDLTYPTLPETATDEEKKAYEAKKAKWASSAVTVGDIANMGWVVSASDNGYTDTVKNANKVDFKGENGISVTGKTTDAGVREITIAIEKGEVIGANEGTVNIDGKDTDVVKVGDKYFKKEDIDPTTGKPKDGTTALGDNIVGNNGQNVVNNGNKFVDGHTVAKAIQESGFTVGKETNTTGVEFNNSDEKVNPNDELRFADGKGTTVSTGTVKTIDPNGEVSTKTVVKVDVDTGVITNNANGSLKGVVSAADAKKLNDDLAKAQAALAAVEKLGDSAPQNVKDAAKAAVYDAEKAIEKAGLNKVATVQNVADAINQSGWNAAVANVGSGVSVDKGGDALVNPGDTVTMTAGNNMQITKDGLNYTIETKKDVNFNSVQFGDNGPTINAAGDNLNVNGAKITGVAPGDITKDSKDAVNGSQIYALTGGAVTNVADVEVTNPKTGEKKVIKDVIVDKGGKPALVTYNVDGRGEYITNSVITAVNNMNKQGIKYFHTNDSGNRKEEMDQQWNSVDSRATGAYSTAVGYQAHAQGDNAVAFGNNAVAGEQGVAIGHGAVASGKQAISIGTGNVVSGNNSGAIGDPNTIEADSSYALGNNNKVNAGQSDVFVVGNNVKNTTSNSVFLGTNSGYVAASETTAGTAALESQVTGGVHNAYAGGKASEVKGVVSVGNVNSDGTMETRRIQNVAPGLISEKSTDAINGSQLYSLAASQNAQIGDIYNKMNREHKGLRAGIAGAAALAGIPEVHVAGRSMIAAAASAYKSENAIAVGYSRLSDNSKIKLKLTGSANTRGDVMGTVGVGYMW